MDSPEEEEPEEAKQTMSASDKKTQQISDDESTGNGTSSLFDHCTDESVSYKFFNFFFYGAVQTFNSYVSVYLKTLGLTASHVGLINGIHPLLQVIGAPLAGILGDKYRIKKLLLLSGVFIMTIRTMLYLPFQPQKQTCHIVYINKTHHRVVSTTHIHYHIMKRSTQPEIHRGSNNSSKRSNSSSRHFIWPEGKPWIDKRIAAASRDKPQDVQCADCRNAIDGFDEKPNLDENTMAAVPNGEVDPFLSPPNVIIEQTPDHKLMYVKKEDQHEIYQIFVTLLCLTLFGEIFEALVSTIADTCCLDYLDYLGDKRESFGLFRFWGALGAGITSPICGAVFDHFGREICGRTISAYHFVFYFYFGYICVAFLSSTHFRYRYDSTSAQPTNKNIRDALWNMQYGIFLLISLYLGLCYGFLTSFSFWFLDDLGANATLLGVASSLRSVSENCVYFVSPIVLTRLGHVKVASGCLLAFSIAFISYSFLTNPWVAIPLEILYTGAYAFSWTTCVSYLNKAAKPGSSTIIQGIVQASFWGLGFGSGSIIGGFSFRVFGDRATFRGFAVTSLVVFAFFIAIQLILTSANQQMNESAYKPLPKNGDEVSQISEEELKH